MNRHALRETMVQLKRDAHRLATHFGLRYRSIGPEPANVKRRYGVCFEDARIQIRLRHAVTGRPLKYSSLIDTLCHELAHLRHFNHGPQFKVFYLRILAHAREQGIYRPTRRRLAAPGTPAGGTPRSPAPERDQPAGHRAPVQLGLFG